MSKLSDVTLRIQASPRAKPAVVHVDRLKPYRGPDLPKWEWRSPEPIISNDLQNEERGEDSENVQERNEASFTASELPLLSDSDELPANNDEENVKETVERRYPVRNKRKPRYLDEYVAI